MDPEYIFLQIQLDRVEYELAQLEKISTIDKLYEPPEVLYHLPEEIPEFKDLLASLTTFEPKLKEFLHHRYFYRNLNEQANRKEFVLNHKLWSQGLRSRERFDPPLPNPTVSSTFGGSFTNPSSSDRAVVELVNKPAPAMSGRPPRRTTGDVVRSEAELNQVLLSLLEQERDNPATRWMGTLAVTPPMYDADPKHIFEDIVLNNNGKLSQDHYRRPLISSQVETAELTSLGTFFPLAQSVVHFNRNVVWTEEEQRIFVDKFLAYPKNFRKIASYLLHKRTPDCVAFYYRNKKRLRLKQLRKMAANEANQNKIKSLPRKIGPGPGRPPKKSKKLGRPPKKQFIDSLAENDIEDSYKPMSPLELLTLNKALISSSAVEDSVPENGDL